MSAVGNAFKKVGSGIWNGIKTVGKTVWNGAKAILPAAAPIIGGALGGPAGAALGGVAGSLFGKLTGGGSSQPAVEGATTDMGMSNQPSFGAPLSMRGDMGGFARGMRPMVMPRMRYGQDMSTSGFGGMGGGGMQQEMPAMMPRRRFGGMGMM